MTPVNTSPLVSEAEFVDAIRSATHEVFATMLGVELSSGDVTTEKSMAAGPASGVVSLIGLAGPLIGTGGMACTGAVACAMAASLLGAPCEAVDESVLDAVGEITNMIIGNVKTVLEEKVGPMGLSIPTVIYGCNFQTRSARIHEWTVVPFAWGEQRVFVQLCVAPNADVASTGTQDSLQIPRLMTY